MHVFSASRRIAPVLILSVVLAWSAMGYRSAEAQGFGANRGFGQQRMFNGGGNNLGMRNPGMQRFGGGGRGFGMNGNGMRFGGGGMGGGMRGFGGGIGGGMGGGMGGFGRGINQQQLYPKIPNAGSRRGSREGGSMMMPRSQGVFIP